MDPIIIMPGEKMEGLYLPIVVVASNQNVDLLAGFAEAFNKHWSETQDVIAIHSEKPPGKLPDNFLPIKAEGEEADYGRAWGPSFRKVIQKIPHGRFMLFLEDQYLVRDVDIEAVKAADDLFDTEDNLTRVALSERAGGEGMKTLSWEESWENAFAPSIWNKDYFCQCVVGNSYSIWQIQERLARENVGDGSVVLATPNPIIGFKNMRIRGANFPTQPSWNK